MSAIATAWAQRQTKLSPTNKLVLLAYADVADDQHCAALTLERLVGFTGLSETTLRKAVAEMLKAMLLEREGNVIRLDEITRQDKLVPRYHLAINL